MVQITDKTKYLLVLDGEVEEGAETLAEVKKTIDQDLIDEVARVEEYTVFLLTPMKVSFEGVSITE